MLELMSQQSEGERTQDDYLDAAAQYRVNSKRRDNPRRVAGNAALKDLIEANRRRVVSGRKGRYRSSKALYQRYGKASSGSG
jgi:hypothetical protein